MSYPTLTSDNMIDVLRLIRTTHIGPITFFQLIKRFGTAAEALDALPQLSLKGGRKQPTTVYPTEKAIQEIEATEHFGARILVYGDPDYPELLQRIPDAPPIITIIGSPNTWKTDTSLAIVGSRNASASGCQLAQKIARELSEADFNIVSGLARGIDSFAHKGAIDNTTTAIIAGGIDNIYPPENDSLYHHIRESGAIISEQPFGSLPFSTSFPSRNRIIAGMCQGTLVVEASPKSGSLITAQLALDYNREVLAVPGSPLDPRAKGCNQLIKNGATLIETASDIQQSINQKYQPHLFEDTYDDDFEYQLLRDDIDMETLRQKVIEKLGITPTHVDILIDQCNINASVMATILLELEIAGRLQRSPGGKVYLAEIYEESA